MLALPAITTGSTDSMAGQLILSLFPGADLLGEAFKLLGACVVRGPDILHGGDVRQFRGIRGRFDGVIGGPPCQVFSNASRMNGTDAVNLIPEFIRIVEESNPKWAVMENVPQAVKAAPDWDYSIIEDFNCGGLTSRDRGFWFYGMPACPVPEHRTGKREYSVMASSWRNRNGIKNGGTLGVHKILSPYEAAYLQGYSGLGSSIRIHQPDGVSETGRDCLAVHMLGNGVPAAMANYVAGHVAYWLRHKGVARPVQVSLFSFVA